VVACLPVPEGLLLDAATWNQTPLVVQQLLMHLLTATQQQEERIKTLEVRLAALEARGQQNSRNSDRPPSSDPPWVKPNTPGGPKGTPGPRPGHPGHRQALLEPTEVIEVKPPACLCGQRVCLDMSPFDTHQVIELPEITMIVRHVVLYEACCPQCGRVTTAHVPPEACAGYGPRLTALIGELSGRQRGSRSAVPECCQSVLGVTISQGAMQRTVARVSEALTPHDEAIAEQARRARVHDIDETGWYQHGVLAWLWVMVNTTVALFKVQGSRSQAAFEALVASWAGILVSDG
jgi:transposase